MPSSGGCDDPAPFPLGVALLRVSPVVGAPAEAGSKDARLVVAEQARTMSAAYEAGYALGQYKRDHPEYDARWDFADAARAGDLDDFRRGFGEGLVA